MLQLTYKVPSFFIIYETFKRKIPIAFINLRKKLSLFVGNTEQAFLNNFDDIVESSLPVQKVMNHLFPDKETAEDSVLGKISYCEERVQVNLFSVT